MAVPRDNGAAKAGAKRNAAKTRCLVMKTMLGAVSESWGESCRRIDVVCVAGRLRRAMNALCFFVSWKLSVKG